MKKYVGGKYIDMTAEEIAAMQAAQAQWEAEERTRPLTESEVSRMLIAAQINTLSVDDATASRMVDYYPTLTGGGSLIPAGTKINWGGQLKRAAVDLWDTTGNDPGSAPNLWEDVNYRSGYRVIPEVITATLAFAEGECGWWGDHLYRSTMDGNVYRPDTYPDGWEVIL